MSFKRLALLLLLCEAVARGGAAAYLSAAVSARIDPRDGLTRFVDTVKRRVRVLRMSEPFGEDEVYLGGFMGVRARVELCRHSRVAKLELSGAPLGGSISGVATFVEGGESDGPVKISEPLATALRRRFISILDASHDPRRDVIVVIARLPLFMGSTRIELARVAAREASQGAKRNGC